MCNIQRKLKSYRCSYSLSATPLKIFGALLKDHIESRVQGPTLSRLNMTTYITGRDGICNGRDARNVEV